MSRPATSVILRSRAAGMVRAARRALAPRLASRAAPRLASALVLGAGLVAGLGLGLAPGAARASSPCPISLRAGPDIGAVDGVRGAEWDDAPEIVSAAPGAAPCLGALLDAGGVFRPVSLRSKTYVGADGARRLAIFMEIQDISETQPGGTPLANGEAVVLQLDPDLSGGGQLSQGAGAVGRDWKIEVRHFWASQPGDPEAVVSTLRVFDSTASNGFCFSPAAPFWNEVTAALDVDDMPAAAVRKDLPGGWTLELSVPLSMIGDPTGDIGAAISAVNDFGDCDGLGVCDGHGVAFPSDLPLTNADNPFLGCGAGWLQPQLWAVGYVERTPGDVTISHAPAYWNSMDVDGLACGSVDNNYYPAQPCRLSVRANIRNASASPQVRNLLILRGQHGAGVVDWHFLDLIEGVSVPAGGQAASVSAEVSNVANLAGHPCVRAYILPPALSASFDLAAMQAISSAADLDQLVAAYGLRDAHSAQQNISRQPEAATCPHEGCAITGALPAAPGSSAFAGLLDDALSRLGAAARPLLPGLRAQEAPKPVLFQVPPAGRAAPAGANPDGLLLTGLSDQVHLGPQELEALGKTDAAVEVIALGWRDFANVETPLPEPRRNLLEVIGGAVDLAPLAVMQTGVAKIQLEVGNPADVPRHVGLSVRLKSNGPDALGVLLPAQVVEALSASPLAPWESRTITAQVGLPEILMQGGGPGPGGGGTPHWLLVLLALLLLAMALVVWIRRRTGA